MESGVIQPYADQIAKQARKDLEAHEWLESIGAFSDPPANIITNFGFLKSPKKEEGVSQEADEGYGSVEPEDLKQEGLEVEMEVEPLPTFFDQIYQDIQNNPDMDIDYLITRNYSESAGTLFLARKQAIANWDKCLRVKSREIRSLRVSTVPVNGKRERVKSARQLEREESEAMWQAAKKLKVEKVRSNSKKASAVGGKVPARPRILKNQIVKTQPKTAAPRKPAALACPSSAQSATIAPRAPVTTVSIPNPMPPLALACPSSAQTSLRQPKKKSSKHQCPVCQKPARSGTCQCLGCSGWVHFKCAAGAHLNYSTDFRCATCLAINA